MKSAITPKKMPINFKDITFLRRVASGIESPTVAIIKAMAVPIGTPLATKQHRSLLISLRKSGKKSKARKDFGALKNC